MTLTFFKVLQKINPAIFVVREKYAATYQCLMQLVTEGSRI